MFQTFQMPFAHPKDFLFYRDFDPNEYLHSKRTKIPSLFPTKIGGD